MGAEGRWGGSGWRNRVQGRDEWTPPPATSGRPGALVRTHPADPALTRADRRASDCAARRACDDVGTRFGCDRRLVESSPPDTAAPRRRRESSRCRTGPSHRTRPPQIDARRAGPHVLSFVVQMDPDRLDTLDRHRAAVRSLPHPTVPVPAPRTDDDDSSDAIDRPAGSHANGGVGPLPESPVTAALAAVLLAVAASRSTTPASAAAHSDDRASRASRSTHVAAARRINQQLRRLLVTDRR